MPSPVTASASGLYDAVFGREQAPVPSDLRPLRRNRLHDVAFTIDTDAELGIVLSLSDTHRVTRRIAGRTSDEPPRVGAITLLPPGCRAHTRITGPSRNLMLALPWTTLLGWIAEDHEVDPDRVEIVPQLHGDDPMLARLLYRATADSEEALEPTLRAMAARLLLHHAARPSRAPAPLPLPLRGGLAPARLRRVLDQVEAGLHGRLTLSALAATAGLSPFHFARAFQRTTGTAPHQHVMRRRVDRAILLLADPSLGIADVARATGFAHVGHLARHMRRQTGLTPGRFRADVLP